jgi:hypothetical protein
MSYISHRGNLTGCNTGMENHPTYIDQAINRGFDVEIDIWFEGESLYLGHDNPEYEIGFDWLYERSSNLWIHCKNLRALEFFKSQPFNFNYFWHQEDDYTLTSKGYIWTYPGKNLTRYSISVKPNSLPEGEYAGVCSDSILNLKK